MPRPRPQEDEAPANEPIVIGWREYVGLPDWGIDRIVAKADTGARSSAIDVGHLVELPNDRVRFDIATDREHLDRWITVEAAIVRRTRVKSSFGHAHERLLVATTLLLGPVRKKIEIGLVSRKRMNVRMLLGRKALMPEFLVDSAHTYRFGRRRPDHPPSRRTGRGSRRGGRAGSKAGGRASEGKGAKR